METSPRSTVDCVIAGEAGEIVLIRRNNAPFKDSYALPGGFVEAGETVEEACRREIKEETNLELYDLCVESCTAIAEHDDGGFEILR
jgi:8-oxo-dGTP diphosphatase